MERCNEEVGSRIKLLRKALAMTQEQLAQQLGIGKAALSMIETGRAALSARNRQRLIQELNVNPEWIACGEGKMFSAEPTIERAYHHRTEESLPLQSVPLYALDPTEGLTHLFEHAHDLPPVSYIHIPNIPKCDGALYVMGDAMSPLLRGGDIVIYKQLRCLDDIFWGDMYLLSIRVDGEEYVTIRYLHRSERPGCVTLASENSAFADKEVELTRICAIALVKASIRINAMH
jgi:transcriptional regulator with XRE-family HTH domain